MIALKTTLNGRLVCTAGANDLCVLNTIVNAIGKLGDLSNPRGAPDECPDIFLHIGGLTGRIDGNDEHLHWTEHQELSVGDEILITVVEATDTDPPASRTPLKSTIEKHDKQRYGAALKTLVELEKKYGESYMEILETIGDD